MSRSTMRAGRGSNGASPASSSRPRCLRQWGEPMVATAVVSVTSIGSGVVRLICRERSPWKVRSVAFDAVCGIGFGVVLALLYLAIRFIR
ncbi:rod shape-determining protein RodA [Bifidobacterium choerinum]|uniref:Rod shape-determining protein RodA n=1 Tax=Bifidobacterium choerinum TaxID=35760 RepID=A0A087AEH2_9BIFI|nr:rod shape-determining protein RodA [Bifidobacterium choerinum]